MLMAAEIDEIKSEVLRLLQQRVGMDTESFGTAAITQAVRNRVSASKAGSPQHYLRRLVLDPAEFQELVEDLVVPETWFFRDVLAFRAVARFLDARRGSNRPLVRVLSVGCSTGEEVYSLAIALREAGVAPPRFLILGTDLSRKSLELAREGTFAPKSFREPGEQAGALRERWFERDGDSWRVREELRAGVQWRCANLAEPEFLTGEPPFHVVFCRNVLIYFHAEARQMAVRHLHRLLSRDGVLCATPAEARIFNAAGFASLGSECPLAFRRRDATAAESPAPAIADSPTTLAGQVCKLSRAGPNAGAPDVRSFDGPGDPSYKPSSAAGQVRKLSCAGPNAGAPDVRSFDGPGDPSYKPSSAVGQVHGLSRQDAVPPQGARRDAGPSAAGEESSGPAILRAARQAADSGHLEEADAFCSQLLSQNSASAEAHCLRGVIHQARGRLNEARRSFEKALYLDPRHYEALVHMMLLAEQTGDCVGAANYRRRADRAAPGEAE